MTKARHYDARPGGVSDLQFGLILLGVLAVTFGLMAASVVWPWLLYVLLGLLILAVAMIGAVAVFALNGGASPGRGHRTEERGT